MGTRMTLGAMALRIESLCAQVPKPVLDGSAQVATQWRDHAEAAMAYLKRSDKRAHEMRVHLNNLLQYHLKLAQRS